ncbi:Peptidase family M23 [Desulfoluna spongiiphila]|uniref:Peptidase family M23 n=2 Tax=Desulfoluna spongiiphila TaxID=419481 RepID=A0A1G5HRY9_9BACT|nr:Peptidase family M23 [Desulfoluna spongiiphila]
MCTDRFGRNEFLGPPENPPIPGRFHFAPGRYTVEPMKRRYTFYIVGSGKNSFRQLALTGRGALVFLVLLVALTSTLSVTLYAQWASFRHQKSTDAFSLSLERKDAELKAREAQLVVLAREINGLKGNLMALYDFEKKIRVIANLGSPSKGDSLFGVGGATPRDIDTNLVIHEQGEALVREMAEQIHETSMAAEEELGRFTSLYDILDEKRTILESTPAICPTTGWISSRFGPRVSPFSGKKRFHKGYDIANHVGTPIFAPADGVVTYAGPRGSMGVMVSLDHGHGMLTRYGHLSKTLKKKGEHVKRGDKIALMGNTGRSTGPHLHYEVHLNGMPVDPEKYILD